MAADHQRQVIATGSVQGQSALDLRRPATVEGREQQLLAVGSGFGLRVVDARIVGDMGALPLQPGIGGDIGEVRLQRLDDIGEDPLPTEHELGRRVRVGHVPDVESRLEAGIAILAESFEQSIALFECPLEVRDDRGEAGIAGHDESVDP